MKVDMQGAARNTFNGIKNITDLLLSAKEQVDAGSLNSIEEAEDIIEELWSVVMEFQPQASAYTINASIKDLQDDSARYRWLKTRGSRDVEDGIIIRLAPEHLPVQGDIDAKIDSFINN